MWLVIFILPFFSAEGYSIMANTTSQLGAQNTPNSWIMDWTFISLGISAIFAGIEIFNKHYFHLVLLFIFGIALSLTGIFKHAPIDLSLAYDIQEDEWHSIFASITGFAFTILAIASAFVLQKRSDKIIAMGIGCLATLLSILMFKVPEIQGVFQRGIFISSFAWLIYFFSNKGLINN